MADQRIIDFTRSVLDREARTMNLPRDTSDVKAFKVIRADVDGGGEDETCFAAGVPWFFSRGVCGLLDGSRFVELVPFQEGFRDPLVTDIDGDGHLEIVTRAQVGSGAFLKLGIFRYDGSAAVSLFPDTVFHQGLLETKDLDLDGVDELVIWEARWEGGAQWQPQPFTIHVYHAGPDGYRTAFEERLVTRYRPASIVSRTIGMFGIPTTIEHRYSPVAERGRQLESLRAAAQATAFTLLERLDMTDRGNREELSRLYSNSGLVRACIGDEQIAIEHFREAIDLDTELGRPVGRSINQTGIANVHRHAGRTQEAITWYEAALHSLNEISDRDRESDANLELGLALTETGQPEQGLERVRRALLLTSMGNLRQQDWKHYLYLGEAHRALNQYAQAEAAFRMAESATSRSATSEIRWQAKYGLGLVLRASAAARKRRRHSSRRSARSSSSAASTCRRR